MGAVCSNAKTRGAASRRRAGNKHTAATSEVIVTAPPPARLPQRPPDVVRPGGSDASVARPDRAVALRSTDVTSQTPPVTSPTRRCARPTAARGVAGGQRQEKRVAIAVENVASVDDLDVVSKDERVRELILGATKVNTLSRPRSRHVRSATS